MVLISLLVSTGLGLTIGFGLGRMKSWLASHEEQPRTVNLDSPLLKTRLRISAKSVPYKGK